MTSLDPDAGFIAVINTLAVEPDQADALVSWISNTTEQTMRHFPGFVSANIHVSLDRCHVVNYAQWRSRSDLDAMLANPKAQAHLTEVTTIAKSFESVHYELRRSIVAATA